MHQNLFRIKHYISVNDKNVKKCLMARTTMQSWYFLKTRFILRPYKFHFYTQRLPTSILHCYQLSFKAHPIYFHDLFQNPNHSHFYPSHFLTNFIHFPEQSYLHILSSPFTALTHIHSSSTLVSSQNLYNSLPIPSSITDSSIS